MKRIGILCLFFALTYASYCPGPEGTLECCPGFIWNWVENRCTNKYPSTTASQNKSSRAYLRVTTDNNSDIPKRNYSAVVSKVEYNCSEQRSRGYYLTSILCLAGTTFYFNVLK